MKNWSDYININFFNISFKNNITKKNKKSEINIFFYNILKPINIMNRPISLINNIKIL